MHAGDREGARAVDCSRRRSSPAYLPRERVRSFQSRDLEACEDAAAALTLSEIAGETELAVDAASLGAAHASPLSKVALASDLATKSILGLDSVIDDRLRMEVTNRLGIFCYYYLDYDRAVEQFKCSLAAAERIGDRKRICRELYNVADSLLLASQHAGTDTERLERAEAMARRLLREEEATANGPRLGNYRLLAEVLCDLSRVEDALAVLGEFPREERGHTCESPTSPWSRLDACALQAARKRLWRLPVAMSASSSQATTSTT